jgi:alpha-galactosidase
MLALATSLAIVVGVFAGFALGDVSTQSHALVTQQLNPSRGTTPVPMDSSSELISSALPFTPELVHAPAEFPITLTTAHSQLVLSLSPEGKVVQSYFGARLNHADDAQLLQSANSLLVPTRADSLGVPRENSSDEYDLGITQADGSVSAELVYDAHQVVRQDSSVTAIIRLIDPVYPVAVTVYLRADIETDVFEQWATIENRGSSPITINRAQSGHLTLKSNSYWVSTFRGAWAGESFLREEEVQRGNSLVVSSDCGVKTSQEGSPAFLVATGHSAQEDEGDVYLGALAWSGNYRFTFKHSPHNRFFAGFGVDFQESPYRLGVGETLPLPRWIITHSSQGKGEASRRLHRWIRNHNLRNGHTPRLTLLNSWEGAYFTFDEPLLHKLMDEAADLGIELFVLDDGWFGNKYPRNNDHAGLGDWQVNTEKLPHLLAGLAQAAKERNIRFGIWVEPEMVNPKSELFEQHPDWVIQLPNRPLREERQQLILDLSRPDVQQFIVGVFRDLLSNNPNISYVKWDCNRKIADPGSHYLSPDKQHNLYVDYIRGYYAVLKQVMAAFPHVTFQACSAGGGRSDLGTMQFYDEFWVSDNTDPCERVQMQWGIGHVFPAIAMASHVTASPNHQTGRVTPLKFRFDVAMSGRLGFELRPQDLRPEERDYIRSALAEYKRIRPIVQLGDLYRLRSPYESNEGALMYVKNQGEEQSAVVFYYLLDRKYNDQPAPLRLAGLDPNKRYRVQEINIDETGYHTTLNDRVVGGDALMNVGVNLTFTRPLSSVVLLLKEES